MKKISVTIISECTLVFEGLMSILGDNSIDVLPRKKNLKEAYEQNPNIILLSSLIFLQMKPYQKKNLIKTYPSCRIICFYIGDYQDSFGFDLLRTGVRGIIYQSAHAAIFIQAIKTVHLGNLWADKDLLERYISIEECKHLDQKHDPSQTLTKREHQILILMGEGYSNKKISTKLFISERTVKYHVYNIFRKLKVGNRVEAVNRSTLHVMKLS